MLCATQISFATDGYFSLGYGTKSKGMAGAGVAMYSNSLIGGNPAGLVFLVKKFLSVWVFFFQIVNIQFPEIQQELRILV